MSDRRTLRPVVAAIFSLLVPGLGHFYVNDLERAIRLYFIAFITVVSALFIFAGAFWTMILSFLGTMGLVIFICVDAIRRAVGEHVAPRSRYQHPLIYILIIAIHVLGVAPLFRSASPYQAYRIPTSSMKPTLQVGDHIMARKTPGGFHESERGQLVVLAHPGASDKVVVKRIVGLEGEVIETRGRSVIVNGRILDEPYATPGEIEELHHSRSVLVPEGAVFVLGDNRGNSEDSRHFGPVPEASIEARLLYRYFSRDRGRIGKGIQ
jgi:signal peptidase I